jgi:predicted Zn finger-like uncharacterized protein
VYTQCSKCDSVFKLSAEVLRAASGQVRCGKCGEVFNALARLAEDPGVFAVGESPLELETRADSILESVVPLKVAQAVAQENADFPPPGVEIAHLEVLDWSDEDRAQFQDLELRTSDAGLGLDAADDAAAEPADRSLEFTLSPGELDRIFVESKKKRVPVASPTQSPPEAPAPAEPHPEIRVTGLDVPDQVRRDMLEGFERELQAAKLTLKAAHDEAQRLPMALWSGAAIVLVLLLIVQIGHQNREWLVSHAHGPLGAAVRSLYGALGAPIPPPANLSAYQLRQWGVTGDPDANGILRLRASILNSAAQLQPYPLLRVTLADRFGKSIGTRDFTPNEYLGKPIARLLSPGERVDATLDILDPGKNAEGFEIDVCLRGAEQRVACQSDAATQTRP